MSIFSPGREERDSPGGNHDDLEDTVTRISAGADERDLHPSFPEDPFMQLAAAGTLALPVPDPIGEHRRRAPSPRSGAFCGPSPGPTARSAAYSMATSTGWNASPSWPRSPCARPSSKPSPRGSYSWESGEPTRYQERGSQPGS